MKRVLKRIKAAIYVLISSQYVVVTKHYCQYLVTEDADYDTWKTIEAVTDERIWDDWEDLESNEQP